MCVDALNAETRPELCRDDRDGSCCDECRYRHVWDKFNEPAQAEKSNNQQDQTDDKRECFSDFWPTVRIRSALFD
jgi:hypothetical protein